MLNFWMFRKQNLKFARNKTQIKVTRQVTMIRRMRVKKILKMTRNPEGKDMKIKMPKRYRFPSQNLILQERKQKVKEDARERRKHKIPKSEKKRKVKVTKKGK